MLSPEDSHAARAGAAAQLRLRIDHIEVAPGQPAHCWLIGTVTGLQRDRDDRLRIGDTISLRVDSRQRHQRCPPGDDLRLCIEDLNPGVLIDAWADPVDPHAIPPTHGVVSGQARLVDQ